MDDLLKRRKDKYISSRPITFQAIADYERENMKNLFPLDEWIDRWVDIKIIREPLKDPFNVSNPILSALNKLKLINDDRYNSCFWPLKAKSHDNILRAGPRKDLARVIQVLPPIYNYEEESTVLPKDPNDFPDFMASYVAPFLMGKVFEMYGKIPILKKEYHLNKDTWSFKMTEPLMFLYQNVPQNKFKLLVELINRFNFTTDEMFMIYNAVNVPLHKKSVIIQEDEKDDLDDPEILEYINDLRNEYAPKNLSWEDSWAAIAAIESKNYPAFDKIYFKLDPTLQEIVDRVKEIYMEIEVQKFQLSADDVGLASKKIEAFADDYPDFLDLFNLVDPRIKKDSTDDEGQWGDFELDET